MPLPPYIRRSDGSVAEGSTVAAVDLALAIAPCELSYIRIDHQARLQFDQVEVVISTEFHLETSSGAYRLDPEHRESLGPLLAAYPAGLASAVVDPDATLRLSFDNGTSIAVSPDATYEAWQVVGPSTALVVCNPGAGGKVSVWR